MPEIAAMGALEGLDVMLNDALYGILFRDINMQRTLVDQFMSRVINGFAGVIINTGEDNYLTTADAVEQAHTVLASDLINEQLALIAGLKEEQMGLGHAFEMDPSLENGFLLELAQAQMTREIFPKATLKYMPPTKFMTGNIFRGHIQDALFNMIGIWTSQGIQLLGMPTEAIHTPFIVSKAVIPSMIERKHGKIINICSMMSELGRETVSAYAAAKGGLKMLTRNICSEYGKYNIQCNGIGPGYIETPQTAPLRERQPDGSRHPFDQFICAKTPANRWLKPEELAGPAVFLASEASDAVNGHILYVDGGILAYIGKQPQ